MSNNIERIELDNVVVKFVGDSGDGMQLTGTIFSDSAVKEGNDIITFPDFPAEIRAPHNTVAGVSGFQVHVGKKQIHTIGDFCDVLVAMNPASLRANLKWVKPGGTIIIDVDTFDSKAYDKAGYKTDPLEDGSLGTYSIVKAPITSMTKKAFEDITDGFKIAEKSRNMFALGITLFIFSRNTQFAMDMIEQKFGKKPAIASANKLAVQAGYNYAETVEALHSTYYIPPAKIEKANTE